MGELVNVNWDEAYPVYFLSEVGCDGWDCEVDPETLARWRKVLADYAAVQEEMKAAGDVAEKAWRARRAAGG